MDRRTIGAILLMMAIAVAPALFLKKPARGAAAGQRDTTLVADSARGLRPSPDRVTLPRQDSATVGRTAAPPGGAAAAPSEDTVHVISPLYRYGVSTRGARLIQATLPRYRSMASSDSGRPAQILSEDSHLLGLSLIVGRDTIPLDDWPFTASAESLTVKGPTPLRLRSSRNGVDLELTYLFHPDDYRIDVSGHATGVGPNGGLLLIGMGPTLSNTAADSNKP